MTLPATAVRTKVLLGIDVDLGVDPVAGVGDSAVGAFPTTLVVGAILVAVAPEYTVDRMGAVLERAL